jgi:hypothetical protein
VMILGAIIGGLLVGLVAKAFNMKHAAKDKQEPEGTP